jgi:hypothetical protein
MPVAPRLLPELLHLGLDRLALLPARPVVNELLEVAESRLDPLASADDIPGHDPRAYVAPPTPQRDQVAGSERPDVQTTTWPVEAAAMTYPGRPAFVFVALDTWTMGFTEVRQVMEALGPQYVAVRPASSSVFSGTRCRRRSPRRCPPERQAPKRTIAQLWPPSRVINTSLGGVDDAAVGSPSTTTP